MKHELCALFFGAQTRWFGSVHVMYLCLQLAGLAGHGQRSSYFIVYEPRRNRGFRGDFLKKKP